MAPALTLPLEPAVIAETRIGGVLGPPSGGMVTKVFCVELNTTGGLLAVWNSVLAGMVPVAPVV